MPNLSSLAYSDLQSYYKELRGDYDNAKSQGLKLDMSRGKPEHIQFELTKPMMSILEDTDLADSSGFDCCNYGLLDGIPEAKRLMAEILEVAPSEVFVGGNSSLNLMHDALSFAYIHGMPGGVPWGKQNVKILCPVPGYDRHFAICEHLGYQMIPVEMTAEGPDMNAVEKLICDPAVKGIWCVPKYSNPQGITFSDEVVRRLAAMKPAANDFRILWDNAYAVHDLNAEDCDVLLPLMAELKKNGSEDMVLMFASTSKITYSGAGIAAVGASEANIAWIKKHMTVQTIGYDKLNQLRHAKFLPNLEAVKAHMAKQAAYLRPKFQLALNKMEAELSELGIAHWQHPKGGYFIALDVLEGSASRVVQLCKDAGVAMTPAGATHPYGRDPLDRTIRIAPTYPPIDELERAMELLCLCVKLACAEHLMLTAQKKVG